MCIKAVKSEKRTRTVPEVYKVRTHAACASLEKHTSPRAPCAWSRQSSCTEEGVWEEWVYIKASSEHSRDYIRQQSGVVISREAEGVCREADPGGGSAHLTAGASDTQQAAFGFAFLWCARWPDEEYDITSHERQARPFDAHILVLKVIEQRPA